MLRSISKRDRTGVSAGREAPLPGAAPRVRSCSERSRSTRGIRPLLSEEPLPLIFDFPVAPGALRQDRPHLLTDLFANEIERLFHLAHGKAELRRQTRLRRLLGGAP